MTQEELKALCVYSVTMASSHRHDCDECNRWAEKLLVSINNHVNEVIGEDETVPETLSHLIVAGASLRNGLREEQRKRAGLV